MRSPHDAPPRPDLGWLRHRRGDRAVPAPAVPAPAAAEPAGRDPGPTRGTGRVDYVHPGRRRDAPATGTPAPGTPAGGPAALAPAPAAPAADVPAAPSPSLDLSLDLSHPSRPGPRAASDGVADEAVADRPAPSLDLSPDPADRAAGGSGRAASRTAAARPHPGPRRRREERLPYPRVEPGSTLVLARPRPTVTLTRLQSGVGQLAVSLVRGQGAGDLALGLVCQTEDGVTHVVQRLGDAPTLTTHGSPLPLVRLVPEVGLDGVRVDLRGVRRLRRALLYGYSPGRSVLTWDGLVVVDLHDGSRLEVPFDLPPLSGTVALLSIYAVEGELVLRSELEPFAGPPETAALAYGYTHGWVDGRLPVG